MRKTAIAKLCWLWQERLLLQDWTVVVTIDPTLESWGLAEWEDLYVSAKITLHPDGPEGLEFYLVHELLHLRLGHCRHTPDLEVSINLLARGFLRAYHRRRAKKAS